MNMKGSNLSKGALVCPIKSPSYGLHEGENYPPMDCMKENTIPNSLEKQAHIAKTISQLILRFFVLS